MNPLLKLFYWIYSFSNISLILLIVIAPILWGSIRLFVLKKRKLTPKIWRVLCTVLLLFCVFSVSYITIGMRNSGERIVCLMPFHSIVAMSSGAIQSSLLNVVLFEPIGLLVPDVFYKGLQRQSDAMREIVLCILISTIIETIQYIFQLGTVEIDDVIFNTLGYAIGRSSSLCLTIVLKKVKQCNQDKRRSKHRCDSY